MFSKLFEMLPDAEHLLSLSAEELAGPLLVSLENKERTIPENVIAHNDMQYEIDRNSHINYPNGCHEDVLFALMEAWQYLVSERFVAPRPTNLPRNQVITSATAYFVTRRGKKIETLDDFDAYRKADLLRKHQLHPIIAEKVWSIFAQGSYRTAVLEAFIQVEIAVREVGDYTKDNYGKDYYGKVLMEKAFDVNDGKLTDENLHEAEKLGMRNLFSGAIGLYRNPSGHREVEYAPEEAAEIIIIASHLLRIVDECKQMNANSSI